MNEGSASSGKMEEIVWDVDWNDFDDVVDVPIEPIEKNSQGSPPSLASRPPPLAISSSAPVVAPVSGVVDLPTVDVRGPQNVKELVRGERFDLSPVLAKNPQIKIELISMNSKSVKLIALGLESSEILAGSDYCVGPRLTSSPCGAITHDTMADGGQSILIRAGILPQNIKRIEISVVSSDPALPIGNGLVGFRLIAGDSVIIESRNLDPLCASSKCATILEIYERQGVWRLRMIGEVLAPDVQKLLALHGAKTS